MRKRDVPPDVSIRFYLRCRLIYRRSHAFAFARAANRYIFPTNRMEVHSGKYISLVATRTHRCNGRVGVGDRLQASIVDTARYNRLLPITSNMSSRADDEESSIILQNKMVRVQRPGEHATAAFRPITGPA